MEFLGFFRVPIQEGGQLDFRIMGMSRHEVEAYESDEKIKIDLPPSRSQRVLAFVGNYRNRIDIYDLGQWFKNNVLIGFEINDMIPDPWDYGKDEKWLIFT